MYQRSVDSFLGAPFNIASMATLLMIMSKTTEIERVQNPNTFDEHLEVSSKGGNIAKIARGLECY